MTTTISVDQVEYVKELYPRLKPEDAAIERYRDALDKLPPIVVARGRVLVDGYHRWQAHRREGLEQIEAEDLGDLTDAEIIRESILRNASHGQQLSRGDKKALAGKLWTTFSDMPNGQRTSEIMKLLSVSERAVQSYTKEARTDERKAAQAQAWDLWLDCLTQTEIAAAIGFDQKTVSNWLGDFANVRDFLEPPESRQHFDVWSFTTADKDAGSQSYFGAIPPQVVQNLLWLYTEPGDIVVDLFAGSGTTIDVAKSMGRRVWASDIRGDQYSPHLPIHRHDATAGWPADAPAKAKLVILDPPYWQQAKGRYSSEPGEMAEMQLPEFGDAWQSVLKGVKDRAERVAFIISPTQLEDGGVVDHAFIMSSDAAMLGYQQERRIIVTYQTQQASGQQVEWARENKRLLKLYRDLVVLRP